MSRSRARWVVILLVGFGLPAYYKGKFFLLGEIEAAEILRWSVVDAVFATSLATLLVFGHESLATRLRRHFPDDLASGTRLAVQAIASVVFAVVAVLIYTTFFFAYVAPHAVSPEFYLELAIIAVLIPLLINGVDETFYLYSERERDRARAERLERERLAARYDALKSQVNPHFLFNCFNTLAELIEESREAAATFVRGMASVYRFVLESTDRDVVGLDEEVAMLESYLGLQRARFGDAIDVRCHIAVTQGRCIVPMTLQLLLENALKHNVASRDRPLSVDIEDRDGHIVVRNRVQPRAGVSSTGIGLRSIVDRYRQVCDDPVRVRQLDGDFVVEVPLIPA